METDHGDAADNAADAGGGGAETAGGGRTEDGKAHESGSALYSICTVANIVRALGRLSLAITGESITQGCRLAQSLKVEPHSICEDDFLEKLVEQEALRRLTVG